MFNGAKRCLRGLLNMFKEKKGDRWPSILGIPCRAMLSNKKYLLKAKHFLS